MIIGLSWSSSVTKTGWSMALAAMVGEKGQDRHLLTCGAFISMLLPLAFFELQRYFVRGLLAGSVQD
jgi:hypothetical protein